MASKKDILDRLDFITDRLSTQFRTITVGVLGVSWATLIADSKTAADIAHTIKFPLLLSGATSIIALLLDFLQYLAGYFVATSVLSRMEREERTDIKFESRGFLYRIQKILFGAKQALATASVGVLLSAIGYYLMK